jgi:hypothetical protein
MILALVKNLLMTLTFVNLYDVKISSSKNKKLCPSGWNKILRNPEEIRIKIEISKEEEMHS